MNTDLFIVGGGLAGLSLALQAKKACPDLDIAVAEARKEPLPLFTGKVGESTVEVGAHYFAEIVGQREHLDQEQLRKFGLRFFFSEGCDDLSQADEVGVSDTFDIPTYQIERSSFETQMTKAALQAGISILPGTRVTDVDVNGSGHRLQLRTQEGELNAASKWVVDASGRNNLVKKKLQLQKPTQHQAGSVWFRVDEKISVDDWSSNSAWQGKFGPDRRWLSTNHLLGEGYWIWIIPLAGGATSIGVVFDETIHPWQNFVKMETTMEWLRKYQPLCAEAIEQVNVLDFHVLKNFAYDSTQVISEENWGLTGEAGIFIDPFYSPGSDFIAYSNTFLTDLIQRTKSGENILGRSYAYQQVFDSIARSTEQLYFGQYPGFYSQRLMSLKMTWDYSYYWGVLGLIFFSDSLTDLNLIRSTNNDLIAVRELNNEMQEKFRVYARENSKRAPEARFVDQQEIPILKVFNEHLTASSSYSGIAKTLTENLEQIRRVSVVLSALLTGEKTLQEDEQELVGDLSTRLVA